MSRLGNHLEKQGLLTREQLEDALQHQAEHGARLGTNLVELRMLRVEQLAEALSLFHNVALPPRKWLERPHRAAVKRVSRPLVERVRFVPMRLDGNVLHAAVMDPRDPRVLDDLRFATGCRIEPYVLPELWMHDWLLALFKIPRGIREIESTGDAAPEDGVLGQSYDFDAAHAAQAAHMAQVSRAVQVAVPSLPFASAPPATAAAPAVPPPPPPYARAPSLPTAPRRAPSLPDAAGRVSAPMNAAAYERASAPSAASVVQPRLAPSYGSEQGASTDSGAEPALTVRSLAELAAAVARPSARSAPEPTRREGESEVSSFWQRKPVFDWMAEARGEPPEPERVAPANTEQPPAIARSARVATPELVHLEAALLQVSERERLIDLSFSIGASFASTLALFVVQRGTMQGLRCAVQGEPRPIDGLLVPIESSSMLADAAHATEATRADSRAHPLDERVLQVLGDMDASEVGLFPVAVKQRVVNVLYASNGREPLGAIAFAALAALAQQMGAAYEQLILHRKAVGSAR